MTLLTQNSHSSVVAAILYQRGVVSLDDAVRMSGISEGLFREALQAVESLMPEIIPSRLQPRGIRIPKDFKLSVLMPVYNEAETIRALLQRLLAVNFQQEDLVVH